MRPDDKTMARSIDELAGHDYSEPPGAVGYRHMVFADHRGNRVYVWSAEIFRQLPFAIQDGDQSYVCTIPNGTDPKLVPDIVRSSIKATRDPR